MSDLVTWLRAQLDEDERVARSFMDMGRSIDANLTKYASRALAEVEAKRRILDLHAVIDNGAGKPDSRFCWNCFGDRHYNADVSNHTGEGRLVWCETVRLLALPYADCPGYLEEWRP